MVGEESHAIATVLTAIALGGTISVFVSMIADRRGRKPILVAACMLGGALTTLTAISQSLEMFAAFQLAARVFTVSAFVLAVIIAVEEGSPDTRGRVVGRLAFFAALGVPAASLAHSGLQGLGASWRGVHIGGVLLVLTGFIASSRISEPNRWKTARPIEGKGQGVQLIQTAALFFLTYAAALSAVGWWEIYATEQQGLSDSTVRTLMAAGYGIGLLGYLAGGRIQDSLGRRRTGAAFLAFAGLASLALFQAGEPALMLPLIALAVFFGAGASAIITTLATEIFVTKLRATALSLNRGVFATLGGISGPLLAGVLSNPTSAMSLEIGDSVSATSLLFFPALMVLLTLPETRGRNLEDVEASTEIPEPPEEFAYEPPVPSRVTHPIYFDFEPDQPSETKEEPKPDQSSGPTPY